MVSVRAGTTADVDAAFAVWDAANSARRGGVSAPVEHHERVRRNLAHPSSFLVVAEDGAEIVGISLGMQACADDGRGEPIPGLCHIGLVMVVPHRWGEGIGGQVLDAILEQAAVRGFDRAQLWTHENNARSRALYRRFGFVESGRRKQSESSGIDILHLDRAILRADSRPAIL